MGDLGDLGGLGDLVWETWCHDVRSPSCRAARAWLESVTNPLTSSRTRRRDAATCRAFVGSGFIFRYYNLRKHLTKKRDEGRLPHEWLVEYALSQGAGNKA